ncbi:hypothetical protein F4604DRAFT_742160 [Suillus subluteus]|nr:hypothetical protein F4604DRAFT_742160 [Suillus subluteus]
MDVQQENLDLVKERDYYRAKCATANTQLASMGNTVEGLKTQLNDSKRHALQLQSGNERQIETQATTTSLNDSKRHVVQLQHDNERMASVIATTERDTEGLRTQLKESKQDVAQLQNDNEQLRKQASAIVALEHETDKLKTQLNESKRRAAHDNKQLQKRASEATALGIEVERLKRQLNDTKGQWENESETRATATAVLEYEVKKLKAQLNDRQLQRESRTVATPVTPAPSKVLAPCPIGSRSASNGASVSKRKRKRLVSEEDDDSDDSSRRPVESDGHQLAPALPTTPLMWKFHSEGLELSLDGVLKDVRDCSRTIASPISTPVSFDLISRLHTPKLRLLDLRLGGYVPAAPGQPGLVLVSKMNANTEACQAFVPVQDQPDKFFYCGIYNCKVVRPLSVKEFNNQGLWSQVKRAKVVLGSRRNKLGQVSVRKFDGIMTRAASQLAVRKLTTEDILEALAMGQEKLYLARLKCIGFDHALDKHIQDEASRMTHDKAKVHCPSSSSLIESDSSSEDELESDDSSC